MTPLAIQFWTIGLWGAFGFVIILIGCYVGLCYLGPELEDENGKPLPPQKKSWLSALIFSWTPNHAKQKNKESA